MLRFLAVLIIFYFVIRFLRGLFQTNVIIKNYHYHDEKKQTKEEGDIKIMGANKANQNHKSDDMGEYVDYEEVK